MGECVRKLHVIILLSVVRIVSKRTGQARCDNGERFIKVSFFIVLIGECEYIRGRRERRYPAFPT